MSGPLAGIQIIEFAGLGPAPFCGMMLADHGADVIRVERPGVEFDRHDVLARNRRSIVLDLKQAAGRQIAQRLCQSADGLLEGFRPGVMERLGLGPAILLKDNPRLVFGRMTGWGQHGPLAHCAGHDINYIALAGVLHTIGARDSRPVMPVNYLGDFGGGGMLLAFAMASAILSVKMGGVGQVIDCAMTDGAAVISAMTWSQFNAGLRTEERGSNLLDGGAPFYQTYLCADGQYIAIGALEPQFYALLRDKAQLLDPLFDQQMNQVNWPLLQDKVAATVRLKSRSEWCALLEGTDVCFAPVLSLTEAARHEHNVSRRTFVSVGGDTQPAPAPRFCASNSRPPRAAPQPGEDGHEILASLGYSATQIDEFRVAGVLGER